MANEIKQIVRNLLGNIDKARNDGKFFYCGSNKVNIHVYKLLARVTIDPKG